MAKNRSANQITFVGPEVDMYEIAKKIATVGQKCGVDHSVILELMLSISMAAIAVAYQDAKEVAV